MSRRQSGFSLIETLIAAAVIAVAAGAWLSAARAVSRFATHQRSPVRAAAQTLAEQTLRTAQDAWKYGAPAAAPSGSVSVNLAVASPVNAAGTVPATLQTALGGGELTVTVRYTPDPQRAGDDGVVTLHAALWQKAPLPGTRVLHPGLVPRPAGAP